MKPEASEHGSADGTLVDLFRALAVGEKITVTQIINRSLTDSQGELLSKLDTEDPMLVDQVAKVFS